MGAASVAPYTGVDMKVKIFPVEGCGGIQKAALKRDDGTVTRWVEAPWPVTLDVTEAEYLSIGRAQTIQCEVIGKESPPDDTTIRVYTVARRAKDQGLKRIGTAAIINAAGVLGIVLKDRYSEVTVTQAEDILTQLKGE